MPLLPPRLRRPIPDVLTGRPGEEQDTRTGGLFHHLSGGGNLNPGRAGMNGRTGYESPAREEIQRGADMKTALFFLLLTNSVS